MAYFPLWWRNSRAEIAEISAPVVGVSMGQCVRERVRDRVKRWDDEAFEQMTRKLQLALMTGNAERAVDLVQTFARGMREDRRPKLEMGDSVALLVDPESAGLLQGANYFTIGSVLYATDSELREIRMFGIGRLAKLRAALVQHGFARKPKKSLRTGVITAA